MSGPKLALVQRVRDDVFVGAARRPARPASRSTSTLSRMCAASLAIAGSATSSGGVGLPNRPIAIASRLGAPGASWAPRQLVTAPRGVRDRRRRGGPASASPSGPSPPATGAGRAVERIGRRRGRQRVDGAVEQQLGRIERAVAEVAPGTGDRAAAAASGGAKAIGDVTAKRPDRDRGRRREAAARPRRRRPATRLDPSRSTHPSAMRRRVRVSARPTMALGSRRADDVEASPSRPTAAAIVDRSPRDWHRRDWRGRCRRTRWPSKKRTSMPSAVARWACCWVGERTARPRRCPSWRPRR